MELVSDIQKPEPSAEVKEAMGVSPESVVINSVEEMGHVVTHWHFTAVSDLHHKLRMPADVGIDIPTGKFDPVTGEEICIDGNEDHKAGFMAGLHYALELLDKFPIKGVPEEGEDA